MRTRLFRIAALGVLTAMVIPAFVSAKTYVSQLNRAVWQKYGINPWSTDTDNDGFSDVWEVQNAYCPTYPGLMSLTDNGCRPGTFDAVRQTYTPPKGLSFFAPRTMQKVVSCPVLENVLSSDSGTRPALDDMLPDIGIYGTDEPQRVVDTARALAVLNGQTVRLIETGAVPRTLSVISLSSSTVFRPDRLMVNATTLAVIGSDVSPQPPRSALVHVELWNITDLERPRRMRTVQVSGSLLGTYRTGSMVYVVTAPEMASNGATVRTGVSSSFALPRLLQGMWFYRDVRSRLALGEQTPWKTLGTCSSFDYATPLWGKDMVAITGISLKNPQAPLVAKGFVGLSLGGGIHFAGSNVFITAPDFNYSWLSTTAEERTEVQRYDLTAQRIVWSGAQTVPGTIIRDGLDVYEGNVRIATTLRTSPLVTVGNTIRNNIYTLDGRLARLGWLEGFAPYERMTAVTFAGPVMYVRTDLSDQLGIFKMGHDRYFAPRVIERFAAQGSLALVPFGANTLITLGKNDAVANATTTVPATTTGASTPAVRTVSTTVYAGYGGVRVGLYASSTLAQAQDYPLVIGDAGSYTPALTQTNLLVFDRATGKGAVPVSTTWLPNVPRIASVPFPILLAPGNLTATTTFGAVYVFSAQAGQAPQVISRIDLPYDAWSLQPVEVTGLVLRGSMLYTVVPNGLMVTDLTSFEHRQVMTW